MNGTLTLKCIYFIIKLMLRISCRDAGRDCDCIIEGETEDEILKNAAEHAVKEHGYKEQDIMTPEMKNKIISLIRKS